MERLTNFKVAILAADGFEEEELVKPKLALEENGAKVHIVSAKSGTIRGWDHTEWGNSYQVDRVIDEVFADDYDALVLPGGVMNPDKLRMNEDAIDFVTDFMLQMKPIAAICHGPWILVETRKLRNKLLTSYPSIKTDLINAGANWTDKEVVVDGNLITSRRPSDLPAFIDALLNMCEAIKDSRLQSMDYE